MIRSIILFILLQHGFDSTLGFSFFDLWKSPFATTVDRKRVDELKDLLLTKCEIGDREMVEQVIADLVPFSAVSNPSTSAALQKKWLLLWTTEKEINLFSDWNLSGDITQTIDGAVLKNCIPFQSGGYLSVEGSLEPSGEARTFFQFTEANLAIGNFGPFKLPPIGKGWFDTVYLDEEFRIDTNSRNDILICRAIDST